ncbi:UDP-N-acetylmuramoyl-tripeptide--D-alanyl-D-alanine ligase [Nocardioides sp. zg-536]|uniref:UDP-N-acetylmuramoyl-tripeptide--D-alanyl-D-alanine ligase n=1 Tax=Nocardioides faecalis TaxID=2803858 RepID=A0A938YAK3_9ACTN|nr:UDP-N-acetylmuramoyl-tripeptide--D-alanyl-D-alanine ligase [Nocardioides faecalis]MBM9460476.1 UDP-N-acetylmuramoyl-tripeptide--D-alanyl-D-alanine ligase [Nocardioides faecalis]QVI57586.1 UDP-N-acetylmuramoyl-tripeptide--D-alanyl-D-alanine ligase [Nocardioides faecalis]
MNPIRLSEVAAVVGGTLHGEDVLVTAPAYIDSRAPIPGGLFVAVAGERVDGHDFAAGAHAVLGTRPTAAPTVVTDDSVAALGRLARHQIDATSASVFALTGSQGKTGTKDYLAAVLASLAGEDAVVATRANHNNELGVPLTVLRADDSTRHVVVEMGARGGGHIAYLCSIAPPRIAAVLNVGTAHVGEFGSREAIAQAKGEIVEALDADGVAVLNADDPLVAAMARRTTARVLTFGAEAAVRWRDVSYDALGRPTFELGHDGAWHPVTLRQVGGHQVANAAAAAAMALAAGYDVAAVAAALSEAEAASPMRMQLSERADGLVVVNDAYNANPESTLAALEALMRIASARPGGRSIAVLGEMRELGAEHEAGHRSVGAAAVALGVDVLVVVGEQAAPVAAGAADAAGGAASGWQGDVVVTAGREEAAAWVRQNARAEDVVLVKASRGAALELVAQTILEGTTA